MNSKQHNGCLILLLLFGCAPLFMQGQTEMSSSVFGNGGDLISGSNNSIHGTIGQTLIGQTSENDQVKKVGFWYDVQYIVTSVEEIDEISGGEGFVLNQSFPNPAHTITTITFSVPAKADVRLILLNTSGQIINTPVDQPMLKGTYQVELDVSDLPAGVYLYQLIADHQPQGIGRFIVQ